MIEPIESQDLPAPVGPYSHAIRAGDMLYISGQLPLDPTTGQLAGEGIEAQTMQSLDNIETILKTAGATWKNVVRVEIFLQDLNDFSTVNELYGHRVAQPVKPARQTVQVARLPLDVRVEISAIAYLGK